MGTGPDGLIFAEPTTWTGSIGVIVPRYDLSGLAEKIGVESASLQTGELKDSLNPFRPLTEKEEEIWRLILADAFDRFVSVTDDNRTKLDEANVRTLATGHQDGTIRLWDVATSEQVAVSAGRSAVHARAIAFSPDGQTLLAREIRLETRDHRRDGAVQVWDIEKY